MLYWIFMILGTGFEIAGDAFFNKSQFVTGYILYGIGTIFWAYALSRSEQLSSAVIAFTLLNIIGALIVAYFAFGEHLSLKQMVGLAFAVVAIVLIEF